MFYPTDEKTPYEQGEIRSVGSRVQDKDYVLINVYAPNKD